VRVELSRDGGASYAALDSQAVNYGSLVWTVTGPGTQAAKVRIRSVASGAAVDSSDAPFTIAAASIAVVPPIVLFGDVQTGTTARETTFVQNSGTDTLRIAQVTVDSAAFRVVRFPARVAPGRVDTMIFSFSPTAVRTYTGAALVTSNASPSATVVQLSGNGAIINAVGVPRGVPDAFALQQNYPNPFNPSTDIRFALPQASLVSLAAYNTLGEKVATIMEGPMEAGWHTVRWTAPAGSGGLPSGVYLVRMNAAGYEGVIKALLLK